MNAGNTHGNRPLGEAAGANQLEAFALLLDLGADIHAENDGGSSVLDGVAFDADRSFYDLVVRRGVEPTMHHAAAAGDLDRLRELLDAGAEAGPARLPGQTPLHSAVMGGSPDSVALLVENGADVHARMHWHDGPHYTPLAMLARAGTDATRAVIARTLLDAGADVDTPAGTFGGTLLHEAIALGDLELASTLLDHAADVNRQDHAGNTPLHKAISRGPIAMVELVLDHGPDLTLRTRKGPTQPGGETPLDYARRLGKKGIVRRLEARG